MGKLKTIFASMKCKAADIVLICVLSFASTWQIGYLVSTACIFGACWGVIMTGFAAFNLFLSLWFRRFILMTKDETFKRRTIWALVLAFLFALTLVFGYQLQYIGYSAPGFSGKAKIVLHAIGQMPLWYMLFYLLLYGIDNVKKVSITGKAAYPGKKIFFISWAAVFVSWIPAFLAYYPMILSYDFHAQVLWSAIGFEAINSHHPYLSTLEIDLFYHIGLWIGNTQLGMAFMAIFHMIITSAAFAYLVYVISKLVPKKATPFIAAGVLGLFPTNPVMTLSTTKDVIFANFFVLFTALIFERVFFSNTKKKRISKDIWIVVTGIMACLWRNNFIYALVVAGIFVAIFIKKKYKLLVIACVILVFIGNKAATKGIRAFVGDEREGNAIEMMSVLVQAYGRTATRNRDSLNPEAYRIISYYLPENIWSEYNKGISDALKSGIGDYYEERYKGQWGDVAKDFFTVFKMYPNEFLDSFLDLTRGYWFIDDTSYADLLGEGYEGRMGIIYTYNSSESWMVDEIKHESKFPAVERFYESIVSEDVGLRLPVVNLFFKISFYTLLSLLCALLFIYKKDYRALGLITFEVFYILTMFLGPVCQFRYAYPWILTLPFFVILFFTKTEEPQKEEKI